MKVRNGFVSNSSTTSFTIYGTCLSPRDLPTNVSDLCEQAGKVGLEVYEDYDDECVYVGRDPSEIGDEETGKQFKDNTSEKIKNLFNTDVVCNFISATISS
jgi:hypothetical protein